MSFIITRSNKLSSLQDLGRYGYMQDGITQGGPMDETSFRWANKLLGNSENCPQIEVTGGHFSLTASQSTSFSLTGADLNAHIDERNIKPWRTHSIQEGETLSFGIPTTGLRAYIGVPNGFSVGSDMGSVSTVPREGLGGAQQNGKMLDVGDRLEFNAEHRPPKRIAEQFWPKYPRTSDHEIVTLSFIPSYQYAWFSRKEKIKFLSATYQVSNQIDRMGYRLSGQGIICDQQTMLSEGIALGSIQVPPDGQPIVLMRDRQTLGGYPKIGCLSKQSTNLLAQCLPGQSLRFVETSINEAEIEQRLFLAQIAQPI